MYKNLVTVLLAAPLMLSIAVPAIAGQSSDACIQGYVWREAFKGDHACVTPAVRAQAAEDNRAAKTRYQPGGGAYGRDTCVQGYVWREAHPKDHVCVKPEVRAQAAEDNRAAKSRIQRAQAQPVAPPVSRGVATHSPAYRAAQEAVPSESGGSNVRCPVSQVRAEIITSLPSPWWQTPQEGGVIETKVANIGGKQTLVCRYQAYGGGVSVMREMPAGMRSCTPVTGGFRCQ